LDLASIGRSLIPVSESNILRHQLGVGRSKIMSEDEVSKWLSSASKRKEDSKRIYSQFKDLMQELSVSDLSARQKEILALVKLIIDDEKNHEDRVIDAYEMVALLLKRVMKLESEVRQLKEGVDSQVRRSKKANNASVH
jgi:rubrerythrin